MDNEIIYLKSDLAFKLVFGREDDARCKYVLKNLLESILNIEINEIKYKNPINLGESIDAKQTEFDISLTIEDKHNCDIEIQLRYPCRGRTTKRSMTGSYITEQRF